MSSPKDSWGYFRLAPIGMLMTKANLNFQFPMLKYGRLATPWTLEPFLYIGGAATNRKIASKLPNLSILGVYQHSRVQLVTAMHDEITAGLVAGGSPSTAQRQLIALRVFFKWLDANNRTGSMELLEQDFLDWADDLVRKQKAHARVKAISLYSEVSTVGALIEKVLCMENSLFQKTNVRKNSSYLPSKSAKSEKEEITDTFTFGRLLLDICEGLPTEKIRGGLPVRIQLTGGEELEEWSGLVEPSKVKALNSENSRGHKLSMRNRAIWSADGSLNRRRPLVNLRIQAELLIFIAQTGMNLAQAYQLQAGRFGYRSHYEGYQVRRVYKDRRKGEVEFEIFSSYRKLFERYLEWRSEFFTDDVSGRLFPIESRQGRSESIAPEFHAIEKRCARLGIEYVGPRTLRKTRQNWILRRSNNIGLTAQMGQHTPETLLQFYIRPNHQTALIEVSRFQSLNDPTISPPGPGTCISKVPKIVYEAPAQVPEPDCMNPSGCLFCVHHRDIDTFDYVWSLASYRYLKSLELSKGSTLTPQAKPTGLVAVVERTTAKLNAFSHIPKSQPWVEEANARVWESEFHPYWEGFIKVIEPGTP